MWTVRFPEIPTTPKLKNRASATDHERTHIGVGMIKPAETELPHAVQLERGFPLLSFESSLEQAYRQHHLRSVHWRVLVCLVGGISFSLWAVLANRSGIGPIAESELITFLRTWVIRPLSLALLVTALIRPLYLRTWFYLAPIALAVNGVIASSSTAGLVVAGHPHAFVAMVAGLLGVLLLLGFLFWQVLFLGVVIAGSYTLMLLSMDASASTVSFEVTVLVAMVVLSLVFSYSLENSQRKAFLQTNILEALGRLDSLTGLRNRRALDEGISSLWQQGVRDNKPLGLLLLDVDAFKAYNDTYGHQAGDRCLKAIANVLAASEQRPLDMAARVGGEEFAVLCYSPTSEHIQITGEKIIASIRGLRVPHAASDVADHVTVSLGAVLVQPRPERSPESFFQFADQALYEAKQSGKDRMVVHDVGYDSVVTGVFKHIDVA